MLRRQGNAPTTCLKFIFALAIVAFSSPDVHAAPDLTGTIAKFTHVVSASGEKLVVKVTVENIGVDTPVVPVTIALWLSDDFLLDDGDVLAVEGDVDPNLLRPGLSTTIKLRLDGFADLRGKRVFITIDEGDVVAESNEENNVIARFVGRSHCMKDKFVLEREPNDTEDTVQRVGSVALDTCVRIDGRTDQEQSIDRFRVVLDGEQILEASVSHLPPRRNIALNFWDVEREEMVGDCGHIKNPKVYHCRLEVPTDRPPYPVDVLVSVTGGEGSYQLRIDSLERTMDFGSFRHFGFAQAAGFFPQFDLPSRVAITRIGETHYEFRLSIFEEGDLVIDDCLPRRTLSRCFIENEVIARVLNDVETQEMLDVFSRVRVSFLPPILCRGNAVIDFVFKHTFTWDDFTAFGITCDVPHIPDDQAQILFDFFERLRSAG